MAHLKIIICDLCKKISKAALPFMLTLQSGKGKGKEVTKAEICCPCYDKLYERIQSEFKFDSFSQSHVEKIEIANGESIVKSNLNNITLSRVTSFINSLSWVTIMVCLLHSFVSFLLKTTSLNLILFCETFETMINVE